MMASVTTAESGVLRSDAESDVASSANSLEIRAPTDPRHNFASENLDWFDNLYDDAYWEVDWTRFAKTLDFGADGISASVTDYHELLQLTMSDIECGIIYVRGNFPDDPAAILARAQNRNLKGGWGLSLPSEAESELKGKTSYTLGTALSRGLINYRWPYMKYELNLKGCNPGTYEICSFIMEGTLYQVVRIIPGEPSKKTEKGDTQISSFPTDRKPSIVGPAIKPAKEPGKDAVKEPPDHAPALKLKLGGAIRFGCISSNGETGRSDYTVKPSEDGYGLSCHNQKHKNRLDMQLFVNGKRVKIADERILDFPDPDSFTRLEDNGLLPEGDRFANMHVEHAVHVDYEETTVLMATFSLPGGKRGTALELADIHSIMEYLGINESSGRDSKRLWNACQVPEQDVVSAIARCVEEILSVRSITMHENEPIHEESVKGDDTEGAGEDSGPSTGPTNTDDIPSLVVVPPTTPPIPIQLKQPQTIEGSITADKDGQASRELDTNQERSDKVDTSHFQSVNPFEDSASIALAVTKPDQAETAAPETNRSEVSESKDSTKPTDDTLVPPDPPAESDPEKEFLSVNKPATKTESAIALIRNIMVPQYVRIESTFWQLRFLIKANNFLGDQEFAKYQKDSEDEDEKTLAKLFTGYKERIVGNIKGVLIWLLKANIFTLVEDYEKLIPSSFEGRKFSREKCTAGPSINITKKEAAIEACYFTMTIWYALKYCPEAAIPVLNDKDHWRQFTRLDSACRSDEGERLASSNLETALAQWHHFGCLKQICDHLKATDAEKFSSLHLSIDGIEKSMKKWQDRVMRSIGPSRRPRTHTYTMKDEIEDRLAFVSKEFHSDDTQSSMETAKACERYVRQRIDSRESTTKINTGGEEWTDSSQDNKRLKSAAWEMTCLNHHTPLKVPPSDAEDHEIEDIRKDCFEFLCSDLTFITSWNESDGDMIGHWWDIDTSAVICSTLIDLRLKEQSEPETSAEATNQLRSPIVVPESAIEGGKAQLIQIPAQPAPQPFVEESLRKLLRMQQDMLERSRGSSKMPYQWKDSKPPWYYHPLPWLKSLDDTPAELFRNAQRKNVDLRTRIKKYFEDFPQNGTDKVVPPAWDMSNVVKELPSKDLLFLTVCDFTFEIKLEGWILGRADYDQIDHYFEHGEDPDDGSGRENKDGTLDKVWKEHFNSHIWAWILNETEEKTTCPSLQKLSVGVRGMLEDSKFRKKFSVEYQRSLLDVVTDCMVDTGTKYRVLFAERCCPSLVNAFMYMWHTEAIDAFNDYFGPVSRFTEIRDYDTWTTSIVLNYWGLRVRDLPQDVLERFDEVRGKDGAFPPDKVSSLPDTDERDTKVKEVKVVSIKDFVEEQSSCLVITGDRRGRFWICSIWSALVDQVEVIDFMKDIPPLLRQFIHTQPVARCLIFLFLLGHLCERLADVYKKFVDGLDGIVNLGQDVFLKGKGLDWKAESAVPKLKKMLWGLEALRVLEDKLGSSIYELKKAAEKMEYIISQEPGQLDNDLEVEYKRVKEEFTKRNELLLDYENTIQMRIKQITGLRDGIHTVTNVEDSKVAQDDSATALKQGKNIKVLTWLTIIYLPLGFVTALFAAGHGIISEDADSRLFTGLIIVFLAFTLIIAPFVIGWVDRSIDAVQQSWERQSKHTQTQKQKQKKSWWAKHGFSSKGKEEEKKVEEEKVKKDVEAVELERAGTFPFSVAAVVEAAVIDPEKGLSSGKTS